MIVSSENARLGSNPLSAGDKSVINLRLILVSGKTKEFLFSPNDSAGDIAQHVFDNWPEDWSEEAVAKADILRLIYQGRFLHSNVTLGALGLVCSKTTVMHLVPRENLPEPNSQGRNVATMSGHLMWNEDLGKDNVILIPANPNSALENIPIGNHPAPSSANDPISSPIQDDSVNTIANIYPTLLSEDNQNVSTHYSEDPQSVPTTSSRNGPTPLGGELENVPRSISRSHQNQPPFFRSSHLDLLSSGGNRSTDSIFNAPNPTDIVLPFPPSDFTSTPDFLFPSTPDTDERTFTDNQNDANSVESSPIRNETAPTTDEGTVRLDSFPNEMLYY
ncbi:hypothetical protein WDU94_011099 [Cyamophila willieti]